MITPVLAQYSQPTEGPVQEEPVQDQQEQEELGDPVVDQDSLETTESLSFTEASSVPSDQSSGMEISENEFDDQDEESTSESVISFNFLYFLLQKFKFSDSLR